MPHEIVPLARALEPSFAVPEDATLAESIQQPLVAALGPCCPPAYRALLDAALRVQEDPSGHSVPESVGARVPLAS